MWLSIVAVTALLVYGLISDHSVQATVTLRPISNVYYPYDYDDDGEPMFALNKNAAEQCAYDAEEKIVYTISESGLLHLTDISDPESPEIVLNWRVGGVPTDVETCGDMVAVATANKYRVLPGKVVVFKKYQLNEEENEGGLKTLHDIKVGSNPDMVLFTKDCRTLLVANEGEAGKDPDGKFVDPEGTVGVIRFDEEDDDYEYTEINFRDFNYRVRYLLRTGVRWVYRNNTTFAQDLEPEYITLNRDESLAYVSLQENNAIAVIDLRINRVVWIAGLGYKEWERTGLDASDKDKGINIYPWPIYGMYQPDAVKYFEIAGEGYIIGANEGDVKKYNKDADGVAFNEAVRGKKLNLEQSTTFPQDLKDALKNDTALGRLKVSRIDGVIDGQQYAIMTYGGRGFSIWRARDFVQIYDSGMDFENLHAQILGADTFNSELDDEDQLPGDEFDKRSDNKGPETESLEVATVGKKMIFFLGNERPSSVTIYSMSSGDTIPRFESMYRDGGKDKTWQELYNERNIGHIDPEDLKFISEEESPNDKSLLLVSGTVSGTLTIYEVEGLSD